MKRLVDTANAPYQRKGNVKLGLIVVAVCVIILAIAAIFVLPKIVEIDQQDVYSSGDNHVTVTSIVPNDGGKIGVGADFSQVYVTVKYSDGTQSEVALSEMIVSGLDVTEEGTLDEVVLDFGGFQQTVTYEVLSVRKVVEYIASTGGTIDGDTIQYIDAGSDASTVVAKPNEGYEFVEWSDGNPNATRTDTKVSVDRQLIATFQKISYTVVFFYPDGTTAREQVVLYNEAATKVPRLTEENMQLYGYKFVSWSESYDHITADTEIYPVYEKYATDVYVDYTLGIDGTPQGSSDALSYYEKEQEAIIRVTANPERIFTGWSVLTYRDGWKEIGMNNDVQTYEICAEYNFITFETSRTGTSDEYVLTFTPSEDTEEVYFKANFVYKESNVTFTSMSTKAHSDVLVPVGEPIGNYFNVEDLTVLSEITGYTFYGWYIRNGEVKADGTPILINNTQTFDRPTDLVAYWEKDMYKVVFLLGDNEDPEFVNDPLYDASYGGIVLDVMYQDPLAGAINGSFPDRVPQKANYSFVGWYLRGVGNVATDSVVDRTFKIVDEVTYVLPIFTVNLCNLTAEIIGSGSVSVAKGNGNFETVTGVYKMEATSDYTIKIKAGTGYTISSINVNSNSGSETISISGDEYTFTLNAFILSDYAIDATFTLDRFELRVINGTSTTKGIIQYEQLVDDAVAVVTSKDITITGVALDGGVTKHIWIQADEGKYIESVVINDVTDMSLPEGATSYTIVLENVSRDVVIQISYSFFQYSVHADTTSTEQHGTIVEDISAGNYGMGEKAGFKVTADTGYYIKAIRVNGLAIDPYNPESSFDVSGIKVTGEENNSSPASGNSERVDDPRITEMHFDILGIAGNKTIVVEYGVLYYEIRVNTAGIGSVDTTYTTKNFGATMSVTASTVDGYFVYSSTINGITTVYESPNDTRRIELANIQNDYDVEFVFKQRSYNVNFSGANAKISYVENKEQYEFELSKTVSCLFGSNHTFKITAEEGMILSAISVNGDIQGDLAFDATEYYFTVDDIDANYDISISIASKYYDIRVYSNMEDEGMYITYPITINDGGTVTISAEAPLGYTLALSNVKVTCTDDRYSVSWKGGEPAPNAGGTYSYQIDIGPVKDDMSITLVFDVADNDEESPYDINLVFNDEYGTLVAKGNNGAITEFEAGAKITYSATAKEGYYVKCLIINGIEVQLNNLGEYTVENASETQNVAAIFAESSYKLTIINDDGHGLVTADKWAYTKGEEIVIRVSAMTGYYVSSFIVGVTGGEKTPCSAEQLAKFNGGELDYTIQSAVTQDNLSVIVVFSPIAYKMVVNHSSGGAVSVSTGTALETVYGSNELIDITATDNYYIDTIVVNGNVIDPATLTGTPRMNSDINKYIAGTLAISVIGDIDVYIGFKPNVYGITIADTVNGQVLVRSGDNPRSNGVGLELHTDDDLEIIMKADLGFHISELVINGETISDWQLDKDQPNNNSNVSYTVYSISGNVSIRVAFEINVYDVKTETINASINFQQYDALPSSYGTVRVYGYDKLADGVTYTGIEHGSDVIFIVTPIRSKGYYVSKFSITWIDPSVREGVQTKTETFTAEAYQTGRVNFNVRGQIQLVTVEFSKQLYSFETGVVTIQNGSTYIADSKLTYKFVNPYEPNNESVAVTLVDGKYEYGLTYILTSEPGEGYHRTGFKVNDVERLSSVRNNMFTGSITTDTTVIAEYTIDVHNVALSSNAYVASTGFWKGEFNIYIETATGEVLLWTPHYTNTNADGYVIGLTGKVEVYPNYLTVTYNTQLRIELAPFNGDNGKPYDENSTETNGYMVSSFNLGGTTPNINVDAFTEKYFTVQDTTSISADFALHTYRVTLQLNTADSGSKVSAMPEVVTWGENTVISMTLGVGYDLVAVYINNTINYVAWSELNENGTYSVNDVKTDIVLAFTLECRPLDITFSGGYGEVFTVDNNQLKSNTGVVFNDGTASEKGYFAYEYGSYNTIANDGIITGTNGARYNDTLTFYFMPVDGYKIAELSIVMYDLSGNRYFSVNDVTSVSISDSARGYYKYAMPVAMLGKIEISVKYAIKTYKVSVTPIGSGKIVGDYAKTVNHHDEIEYVFRADYGYHMSNLTINGNDVLYNYEKKNANSYYVYEYTTTSNSVKIKVNNALINGYANIEVRATFEVNIFDVKIFVNSIDISALRPDTTLTPVLPNNSIQYGKDATGVISQNRAEGYSITSIKFKNQFASTTLDMETSDGGKTNNMTAAKFSFPISGAVMDMLDYHNPNENVLYIYYTTAIDTHTSVINSHLYENGMDVLDVPTTAGSGSVFVLSSTYSDGVTGNENLHDYFTTAEFNINIKDTDNYEFAGYQEYDVNDSEWKYVVNGVNGIKLTGTKLEYTIKADRQFRAVVFRVYDVKVEVHPEYKYLNGSVSGDTISMLYRTYIKMTASINYDQNKKPNTDSNTQVLTDMDTIENDGVFEYRVYAFASLMLNGVDKLTGSGMNVSKSVSYYFISTEDDGGTPKLVQTEVQFGGNGSVIDGDKLVHAYYDNTTYLSFIQETVGGATGNEGGKIEYYVVDKVTGQQTITAPSGGNLKVSANGKIRIVVTPNANYDFQAIQLYDVLDTPDPNGNKQFNGTWSDLESDAQGFMTIKKDYSGGKVTKVTIDLIITENMIFKVQFWKLIKVSAKVELVSDETDDTALINAITPTFDNQTDDGVYRYGDEISYVMIKDVVSDKYDIRYQFVGYMVNGVNAFKQLSNSYPNNYEISFTLRDYDANEAADGIYIVHDGTNYVANVVAKYVPIYNIIIENEYKYEYSNYATPTYFDVGQISYRTTAYNHEYPLYYSSTSYVSCKTSDTMHTDNTIQVMGKINSVSGGVEDINVSGSSYNNWKDNSITLSWVSGSITQYTEKYNLVAWQYYSVSQDCWVNIDDSFSKNASNKATSKTFTFPIGVLFEDSYLTHNGDTSYLQSASQYSDTGSYDGSKSIYAIRIRPLFDRVINVSLDREVFYTSYGVIDNDHSSDNPALILENRATTGTFEYYDVITMIPSVQTGYKFLGWYLTPSGQSSQITTSYTTNDALTPDSPYAVSGDSGNEKLYVRLVDNEYVDSKTNYFTVYARYIKIWTITFMTKNESGDSDLLSTSVPYINYKYTRLVDDVVGGVKEYSYAWSDWYPSASQIVTIICEAGATIEANFYTRYGTQFDMTYDKYVRTETVSSGKKIVWEETSSDSDRGQSVLPLTSASQYVNSMQSDNHKYIISANGAKTITAYFKSYGELTINNVYYGSTVQIPERLRLALGIGTPYITDGGANDADGMVNASIKIVNIPITPSESYNGKSGDKYENILPNTNKPLENNNYDTGINFSGNGITDKRQTFNYYKANANDVAYISMYAPFADGLNNQAGNGTAEKPYKVTNVDHLKFINTLYLGNGRTCQYSDGSKVNRLTFKLYASFSASGLSTPLCTEGNGFNGKLDGGGYYISNLSIKISTNNVGLFGKVYDGVITNLQLHKSGSGFSGNNNVGSLAGYVANSTISEITYGGNNYMSVAGYAYVGGLIGYAINSTITSCSLNMPNVSGIYIGGLIGYVGGSSNVSSNYIVSVIVNGTQNGKVGGGLIGQVGVGTTVSSCSVTGSVTLCYNNSTFGVLGGAIGYNQGSAQNVACNLGNNTINTRRVSNFNDNLLDTYTFDSTANVAGGVIGYNEGEANNCRLEGNGTLSFFGNFGGGVIGVNTGKVISSNSGNYQIRIIRDIGFGGVWGLNVGVNAGTIDSAYSVYSGGNDYSYTDSAIFIGNGSYSNTSMGGNTESQNNENATICIGGVAGYNTNKGIINNSRFTGKLYVNRRCGACLQNKTYIGNLIGYNKSSKAMSNNTINNAYVRMFLNVWADAPGTTAVIYQYLGDVVGYSVYIGSASISGCHIQLDRVANGSNYSPRKNTSYKIVLVSYSKYTSNASGYKTAKVWAMIIRKAGGGTSVAGGDQTTSSIPGDIYNKSNDGCKEYTGNIRQFTLNDRIYQY